ncbi:MAG: terminase family protein [Cyanobacteria bacterium P01_F01_bin.150]
MSDRLVVVLQRVADGELLRVMCFLPPRHGKSELISRLFSAYYLYRYPEKWVGINSYAASLAYGFSRSARANFRDMGGPLSEESRAVDNWETTKKGGYWAAGVGGPITGKGFSLGIIDDPLKNAEEANSSTIRDKQKDWYLSTFYTRAEEDAAIVIVQTRWHQDDLSGWLLENEKEEPENWHIVSLEAIKTESEPVIPDTCTLEPDWRKVGEPLNPVRLSLSRLKKICGKIGSYFWEALYQQRPSPLEGGKIKRKWIQRYSEPPLFDYLVQSWDTASKAKDLNCPWCCTTWGVKGAIAYLLDVHTHRYEYPDGKHQVQALADKWQPLYVLIEDKSTGQSLLQEHRRDYDYRYNDVEIQPEGDKITRMVVESAAFEGGRAMLPEKADWLADYEKLLFDFPAVAIMDPIDSTSQFLRWFRSKDDELSGAVDRILALTG